MRARLWCAVVAVVVLGACGGNADDSAVASTDAPLPPLPSVPVPAGLASTTTAEPAPTSTSTSTSTSPPPTTGAPEFSPRPPPAGTTVCDRYDGIESGGAVANGVLREISGIAAGRVAPGVLWAHNDSGGEAAVYAIGVDGADLGTFHLEGVFAFDWEDIAAGPGTGGRGDFLYIGDIGDNLGFRPEIVVYRVPEPDLATSPQVLTDFVRIRLRFPEPGVDAEALAVDPVTGDLFVVTKEVGRAEVFRAEAAALDGASQVPLERIAMVDLPNGDSATAADFSGDGTVIALRGYDHVWLFSREDLDVAAAFAAAPCAAPSPVEVQGEALAFDPQSGDYFTISEGTGKDVFRVVRRS